MMKNILIVEDDPVLQRVFTELLGDEGYAPRAVSTIEAAIPLLDGCDLVLLDLKLGERSGAEILDALARRDDAPAVVVMSATPTLAFVARDFSVPFLAKPFAIDVVLGALSHARQPTRPPTTTARRRALSLLPLMKL
jgi:DNA-binding NtrC family response regulator